ncbi:MAG TPA: bifunctional phosphoglucose/phosphomannose isomerase [Dehalococcoidia bacterium]|nr:bifunctional phosphoglucose/phosphomannose isomerase [Dehalococcoidia bacterium]
MSASGTESAGGTLDDPRTLARLDPGGMLACLRSLPEQCREAWDAAKGLELPASYQEIDRIAVLGMGGSAIAGDFWRALLERECAVPVFNIRAYDLPPYIDERTLVVASSFSGDTEEVLSAFAQALAMPAPKIAVTAGGQLLATARANGIPVFTYDYEGEPRAALGWTLMPLLAIAESLRLMQGIETDVEEAIDALASLVDEIGDDVPLTRNPAKQLAQDLHGRLPVVYGTGALIEVARRWKTQLNESGKVWAFFEDLPELHHNAIIGYTLPREISERTAVVFLESADLVHRRVQLRYDFTKELLSRAGVSSHSLVARGKSALAQMLSLALFGDYVSAYLAFIYDEDPTPTAVIDELKAWLAKQE